jgi:hypothetical protein
MNRKEYLETAADIVCNQRQSIHGSPEDAFGLVAQYWSDFLTKQTNCVVIVHPSEVAVMMTLFKIARWQMNPNHLDNVVDGLGYLALAGELQDGGEWKTQ